MAQINGKEYTFANITIVAAGRSITGIRGINYGCTMEKEFLHGKGNEPLSIQSGNKTYEGELSITQSEYLALKALGDGSVLDMNIDMVICYGNPARMEPLTTETLYGVEFTEEKMEWSQGDRFATINLPFMFLRKD